MKHVYKYILTLVAILMVTSNAWAATATLGAKKQSVTADGITFSLGGNYNLNTINVFADYSSTGSGKEATLSWTVPTGYTISVSQITINAKNDRSWGTTGKGQYKTSKNGTYTQFCNSNSWSTYTLSSSSYFPLGNGGSITLKAVDKELQWKDIVFTYTKTAHKYNIAFNANGGTGETEDISNISYDTNVNLTPNGFTYNKFIVTYDANGGSCSTTEEIGNYKFAGWAETSNGAVKYTDGQSVTNLTSTDGATVTLYAKWNEPDNATITLPTATKTGAVLEGWYLGDTKIGEAGDTYTPTSSVTLTAKWIEKYTPEIKGSDATILVGEEIPNAFTFKNTSNPTAIITKKSISDIRNGEDVITYNAAENKIIAHNAGIAEIYFIQEPTTTIEGGTSATYTITVNKNTSYFTLNFADEYFVDDQIAQSTFFISPTNTEVAISVTDNKGYFSYTNDNLIAKCPTQLPADNDQTTITVTQPENYKWTSYTQEKTVTVKKHQTNFAWNDGESLECYVDDQTDITNLYTKASDNTLPVNFNVEVVERGYGNTDVVSIENGVLKAIGEGKVVVTASQAVDRKWTDFSTPITITVKRYDVSATLNPTTTVWNATHSNPFSVSISPANGETITDFIVGESSNSTVATYNASSKTIQTYYTSGSADFQVTRPEDRKYNALDQTLTLTVDQNTNGCYLINDPTHYKIGAYENNNGIEFSWDGIANTITFDLWKVTAATQTVYVYGYDTNGTETTLASYSSGNITNDENNPNKCSITVNDKNIVRIKIQAGGTLNKHFKNLKVTRDEYITPSIAQDGMLKLPTVAIYQVSTDTFTLNWSTCSNVVIESSNSKFSIGTSQDNASQVFNLLDANGTNDIIVYCNTSEIGIYNGIITIYDQSRSVSFNVTDTVNDKWTPVLTGEEYYSKHVGDTWPANFTFKNTETTTPSAETSAPFYFTIDHQSFVNTDRSTRNPEHLDEVISYDPETNEITAYNAGTAVLTFIQKDTDGYYAGSRSCTITVAKNETNFELNLADLYLVDAEVPTANILKNKSNNEVDIQVSDMTTDNRALFTYNGSVLKANGDQLQADSETTTITVSQPETYKWTGKTLTKDVTVKKYDSQFSFTKEGADYVCKIDDIISESDFYSLAENHEIPATINVEILERANEDHPEVLIFNEENHQWEAKSAGKAKVTISQPENRKWTAYTGTRIVEIQKHTPIFTWKDPVYFNQTISDYYTTNNNPDESEYATDIVISQESTDPDVAIIYFNPEDETDKHTLDLTTYYKETTPASSTTVTVFQAENWYWYAKEDTHTITPQNRNNHISNTPITETNLNNFKIEYQDPWNNPWTSDGIHFGQGGIGSGDGGYNWNDKYIIIEFTGVPDSLYFTTATTGSATMDNPLTGNDNATNNKFFYVSAGTSKDNLKEIWSSTSKENNYKDKLDPSVRFLKLCYTGNLEGWFKNVRISELNQFDAVPNSLDFGTVTLDDNPSKDLNFNLHYANAGYNVTLDLDRTGGWATEEAYNLAKQYIRIEPATITTIGGEKHGTVENIKVTLHSDDQTGYTIPANARLKISDEAGHTTYVNLSGKIEKSTQTITWNDYFSLQEPIQIPISTDSVRGAAKASSNLPVKYRSEDDAVIKVNDNGSCFIPAGVGTTTITAYQEGNNQYAYVESTKQVQVTGKSIQLINWTDDLSDLIFYQDTEDPDSIALTAQVYIIDVVNSTFEFSQEQTDRLVYTIAEGGESIIKITNDTLTMLGIGETTITVTIEADEHHEGATMTIPVIVREPAMGCEDKILITPPSQIEFFQMNTDEISKDAIAINRAEGVPGFLLFSHIGKQWTILGMNFYTGTIKAQQSTDGGNTWQDVADSEITPTLNREQQTDPIRLDRNATHIRFVRPAGGQGYHYVTNIKVVPVQYVEVEQNTIDFENINMGGVYQKTFTISYSNIKSPLIATTSSKDVTVNLNRLGECGQFGEQEITVTWKPNNNQNQSVTFQDTLANLSVTVNLMANIQLRKQKIVWENRKSVIWDYTDIDNRPTHTRDVNNNELIDLPITYKVTEGTDCAYFEDNMFFIINKGSITIQASNPGNEEYLAVDSTYQITIQDIPPTFIGGAENDLWSTDANWVNGAKPDETQTASITAPVTITNEDICVNKVRIASAGSIHITPTGGLTVGEGGVQCVTTDGSAIIIDNLHSGAGFFRISPDCEDELPRITMRYQTKSTLDKGANKDAEWQYIGAPGNNATVYVDYNTWLYKHDEASADWVVEKRMDSVELVPFHGYSITQYGQPTYEWTADFTNQNDTIPLTYSKNGRSGRHIIANSYTAPINVAAFTGEEFTYLEGMSDKYRIEKTLYIFNSGSWNNWNTAGQTATGSSAGQYYAIPVKAAAAQYLTEDIGEQTTITPMQGIYLRVRSKKPLDELPEAGEQVGNLILNYEQLVMGSDHQMHRPMRAPQRTTSSAMQDPNFRRVRIVATSENSGADRVYIIQDNINTRKYNNGYDAPNQETKGLVNIYTNESGGKMEVSCSNNIDSMYIGFMAGEDQTYTLHFGSIIGNIFYLDDLTTGETINIVEGGTYTFNAEPQSTNDKRFLLRMPRVSSNADALNNAKIWSVDKILYVDNAILPSPLTIYDVSGHHILSDIVDSPQYSIDLSHLLEGVYLVRVNNQVYKFISK